MKVDKNIYLTRILEISLRKKKKTGSYVDSLQRDNRHLDINLEICN